MITAYRKKFYTVTLIFFTLSASAQDKQAQFPKLLQRAYVNFQMGYINTPFTNDQLQPGFRAERIKIPHLGVRIIAGYRFSDHLSTQISFMRPGPWVDYININGDNKRYGVWMTIGGITIKPRLPLNKKLAIYGEAGLGIITRHGFRIDQLPHGISDASYASVLFGGGIEYNLNKDWDLSLNAVYNPKSKKQDHPYTLFISAGITYKLKPLPEEKVKKNASGGYAFPKHMIQLGISHNFVGYDANKFFSTKVPIFWEGQVEAKWGLVLAYQKNVFHTRRLFSLNWGADISYWRTTKGSDIYSVALYPMFRLTPLRTKPLDGYIQYSVAGPAFLSKRFIDGFDTGRKFTFQDLMGMGFLFGREKNLDVEFVLGHYSNGNIFPRNAGVKLPLQLNLGYCF